MSFSFLMCSERAGSNFIVKLLNGHSNICGPSTKHIINPVARNLFRYEPIDVQDNWNYLIADIHNLMSAAFSVWRKQFSVDELKGLARPGDIVTLIRNIFMEEARANGKQHVFIKENHVYEFLPFLLMNFPEAKYVYQYRDPRDVALSWKKSPDHPGGVVAAARQWQKDQQSTLKNVEVLESLGKVFSLSYEELIDRPVELAEKITGFLGIPHDPAVANFYKDDLTRANAQKQGAWSNLEKGVMSDNKEKYRKELTDAEVLAVEKICWYEMRHLGYMPEFSREEVEKFSNDALEEMNSSEFVSIPLLRSDGVKENMEAKRRFYQRDSVRVLSPR